ncbi:hypothetical protein [Paenibacillus herberti]|uniref:Uncharacterized protein n=1 Tax=Paenibacillus herberti TaxID=1619309 RepID=A0A229NXM3_9BACL|nr:hypothetical protein [Paenibacillus herberti]OXM14682.1 hypothetical protein CGZ75_17385 [Paenibacillus herberti]
MKRNFIASKVAVASLMFAAIASPLVANAAVDPLSSSMANVMIKDENTKANSIKDESSNTKSAVTKERNTKAKSVEIKDSSPKVKNIELKKMQPMTASSSVKATLQRDPLELAKKYAPNTVGEWKETLGDLDQLVQYDKGSAKTKVDWDAKASEASGDYKKAPGDKPALEGKTMTKRIDKADGEVQYIPATELTKGITKAEKALNAAVKAGDKVAIEDCLGNLLDAYQVALSEHETDNK